MIGLGFPLTLLDSTIYQYLLPLEALACMVDIMNKLHVTPTI